VYGKWCIESCFYEDISLLGIISVLSVVLVPWWKVLHCNGGQNLTQNGGQSFTQNGGQNFTQNGGQNVTQNGGQNFSQNVKYLY
jgi:hypothetical protein